MPLIFRNWLAEHLYWKSVPAFASLPNLSRHLLDGPLIPRGRASTPRQFRLLSA